MSSLSNSCPSLLPSVPTSRTNWLGPVPTWQPTEDQLEEGAIHLRAFELHCAVWNDDLETIERLVSRRGVNVESLNAFGQTPLFVASYIGQLRSVRLLLLLGSDPNELCEGGYTAVHGAFYSGSKRIVSHLLEAGGDIDAIDCWKMSPLYLHKDWLYQQSDVRRQNRVLEIVESRRRWPINTTPTHDESSPLKGKNFPRLHKDRNSNDYHYQDRVKYDEDYYCYDDDEGFNEDKKSHKGRNVFKPLEGFKDKNFGNNTFDDLFEWDHIERRYRRRPFYSPKSSVSSATSEPRRHSGSAGGKSYPRNSTRSCDLDEGLHSKKYLNGEKKTRKMAPNTAMLTTPSDDEEKEVPYLPSVVSKKRAMENFNKRFLLNKSTLPKGENDSKRLLKVPPRKRSTDVKNTQTDLDLDLLSPDEPRKKSFVDSANEFARRKKSSSLHHAYPTLSNAETQTNGLVGEFQRVKIKDHFYSDKAAIRRRFFRDRIEQEDESDRPRSVIPEARPLKANEKFLLVKEWERKLEENFIKPSSKQQIKINKTDKGSQKPSVPMPSTPSGGFGGYNADLPPMKLRPPKHSSPVMTTRVDGTKTRDLVRNGTEFPFDVDALPISPATTEVNVKKLAKRFQFLHNLQMEEKKKEDLYRMCRDASKKKAFLNAQAADDNDNAEKAMNTALSETLADRRSECDMLEWDNNDLFNTLSQTADDN